MGKRSRVTSGVWDQVLTPWGGGRYSLRRLSLSPSVSLWGWFCFHISVSLSVSSSVSISLFLCFFLCVSFSLCVSLCLCLPLFSSFSLSLRLLCLYVSFFPPWSRLLPLCFLSLCLSVFVFPFFTTLFRSLYCYCFRPLRFHPDEVKVVCGLNGRGSETWV